MCFRRFKTLLVLFAFTGFHTGGEGEGSKLPVINDVLLQRDKKCRSFGIDAVDTDFSAHQFYQLMNDAEPQPGAFDVAVFLFIHPFEGIENIRDIFLFYTESGILHRIPYPHPVQIQAFAADGESDRSFACVFYSIVQKIDQYLFDTYFIAAEHARDGRIHMKPELQSFFSGLDPDHVYDL